jgi:glycosyltransferase involved in cell wall biosynthesis
MRVAQIAPLTESVPPTLYGGTERIVSYLTEELTELGHDVTLFASGDSKTSATLVPIVPRALRFDPTLRDGLAPHFQMLERVYRRALDFDVLHFHVDYWSFPLFSRAATPFLTTLHGRLDLPEHAALYELYSDAPLVSISFAQRRGMLNAQYAKTIHHGLPVNLLRPQEMTPGYLAFLGRISPEKRPDRAIRIARRVGMTLKIAAKIDRVDQAYFDETIRPMIDGHHVEMIGEITDAEKPAFLSGAHALLMPIDWPEPFGLVMIEAMACGTPVIAFAHGSVPEIVDHGMTGFVVSNEAEAADAVHQLHRLSRPAIRRQFERRFTARRMANDYVALYRQLATTARPRLRVVS